MYSVYEPLKFVGTGTTAPAVEGTSASDVPGPLLALRVVAVVVVVEVVVEVVVVPLFMVTVVLLGMLVGVIVPALVELLAKLEVVAV